MGPRGTQVMQCVSDPWVDVALNVLTILSLLPAEIYGAYKVKFFHPWWSKKPVTQVIFGITSVIQQ